MAGSDDKSSPRQVHDHTDRKAAGLTEKLAEGMRWHEARRQARMWTFHGALSRKSRQDRATCEVCSDLKKQLYQCRYLEHQRR